MNAPRRAGREVDPPPTTKPIIPSWLIPFVCVTVLLMGGASIVLSVNNPAWSIPPFVHAAVAAVVTGVMGYLAIRGRGNGAGNGTR